VVVPPSATSLELGEWFNFNDSIVSKVGGKRFTKTHLDVPGSW